MTVCEDLSAEIESRLSAHEEPKCEPNFSGTVSPTDNDDFRNRPPTERTAIFKIQSESVSFFSSVIKRSKSI